jgi:hypothetical protein
MRVLKLAIAAAVMICSAPSFGQEPAAGAPASDTVKAVVEKGSKLSVMDMEFVLTYKADGTYTDDQGSGGKYRVDGKKLCLTPEAIGQELCSEYPDGKKSGDKFEIQSDFGPMTVTVS